MSSPTSPAKASAEATKSTITPNEIPASSTSDSNPPRAASTPNETTPHAPSAPQPQSTTAPLHSESSYQLKSPAQQPAASTVTSSRPVSQTQTYEDGEVAALLRSDHPVWNGKERLVERASDGWYKKEWYKIPGQAKRDETGEAAQEAAEMGHPSEQEEMTSDASGTSTMIASSHWRSQSASVTAMAPSPRVAQSNNDGSGGNSAAEEAESEVAGSGANEVGGEQEDGEGEGKRGTKRKRKMKTR